MANKSDKLMKRLIDRARKVYFPNSIPPEHSVVVELTGPYFNGSFTTCLEMDIIDWLLGKNIIHQYKGTRIQEGGKTYLIAWFRDPRHAMEFKLAWTNTI